MNMRQSLKSFLALAVLLAVPTQALGQAAALNSAVKEYNEGDYADAAFGFYEVAAFDSVLENRLKAEYYLAQSLRKMGLVRTSAFFYQAVMQQGPQHPYYLKSVEELVDITEKIDDELFLPTAVAAEYNAEFARLDPQVLYKVNYLVGFLNYRRGNLEEAVQYLNAVPREASYHAKALYLQGIIKAVRGSAEAVKDYEAILELQDGDAVTYWELGNTQQLARLALGRLHFSLGNFAESKRWYESIDRYTDYWDVALSENGWASYKAGDIGTAMGSLHTLQAPQFTGAFQPESLVLKATVYYWACLYEEVQKELATFDERYKPMAAEVNRIREAHMAQEDLPLYVALVADPGAQPQKLPKAVRNLFLDNQRIRSLLDYITLIDREIEQVGDVSVWKGSSLQKEIVEQLQAQRRTNVLSTGKFIRDRLKRLEDEISQFDGQADILRFETSKAEKELLEAGVDPDTRLKGQALLRPEMPGDDWQYWSFDGEWWVDELGYYKYTLKSACEAGTPGAAGGF